MKEPEKVEIFEHHVPHTTLSPKVSSHSLCAAAAVPFAPALMEGPWLTLQLALPFHGSMQTNCSGSGRAAPLPQRACEAATTGLAAAQPLRKLQLQRPLGTCLHGYTHTSKVSERITQLALRKNRPKGRVAARRATRLLRLTLPGRGTGGRTITSVMMRRQQ